MSAGARAPLLAGVHPPLNETLGRAGSCAAADRPPNRVGRSAQTIPARATRARALAPLTERLVEYDLVDLCRSDSMTLALIRRHRVQSLICSLRISFRPAEGEGDRLPLHLGDVLVDAALIESFKTGHADVQRESPLSGLRLLSPVP